MTTEARERTVWLLNHYAQEPGHPGGTRHYCLAKYLPDGGWRMVILASSVELNTGRQRLGPYALSRWQRFGAVPFFWIKTPRYRGNGVGRILNMLAYTAMVLVLPWAKRLPAPDVIIGSSVHPFAAWSAAILARIYRVPFLFEVRDLWPQTLIDLGTIKPDSLPARGLRQLEQWLYQRADRIITLLPHADDYIVPLGIPGDRIVWLSNGVDLDSFAYSAPWAGSKTLTLMYFGAHGNANCLDDLLWALALLRNRELSKPIRVRLIGDGPLKKELMDLARSLDLNMVTFESPVPKDKIPVLAADADFFVVTLLDLPVYRYGISLNKLFDYMAAGRPVVLAGNPINNPVADANAGITVPPRDPEALATALQTMIEMSDAEREQMGRNARRYVEQHYDYPVLAQRLAQVLDQVSSPQTASAG
jgi:glycosyltransferase involved in cell wall biosynthesis